MLLETNKMMFVVINLCSFKTLALCVFSPSGRALSLFIPVRNQSSRQKLVENKKQLRVFLTLRLTYEFALSAVEGWPLTKGTYLRKWRFHNISFPPNGRTGCFWKLCHSCHFGRKMYMEVVQDYCFSLFFSFFFLSRWRKILWALRMCQ